MSIFFQNLEKRGKPLLFSLFFLFLLFSWTRAGQKSDFLDYYHAGQRWLSGENLYKFDVALELQSKIKTMEDLFRPENIPLLLALQTETATYIYPPVLSFLLLPITFLSEYWASFLFQTLSAFSLLGISYLLLHWLREVSPNFNLPYSLLLLTFLCNFRFLESHVQNNQVGLILVLLVLFSLLTKKESWGGFSLALAVSIKVTPIVFIFVFVYKKQYARIVWFLFGLVFWNFIPALYNAEYTWLMTQEWVQNVLGNALTNPLLRSWKNNQSLSATLAKYFVVGADWINQPSYKLPFTNLSTLTIQKIQLGFVLLFGLPILWLSTKKNQTYTLVSLLFLVSVLFSGISWVHTFVVCLFPSFWFLFHLMKRQWTWVSSFSVFLLLLPTILHRSILGSKIESFLLMYSILFYTTSILFILILKMAKDATEIRN